jgi:MoaA/NifB/PqqE/SkfB family radical SAM enzyme
MSYKSEIFKANRIHESIDFPKTILIDNCNACNMRCSMCDHKNVGKYRKIQTMNIDLYKKIINEIAIENTNARVWEIFFGDPFLCKDISYRVRYAKNKGLTDVVLNSNGALMNPEKSKDMILAGLDAMYIGVDASSKESYDKIRIGGDFSKTVENVLQYRDLLGRYGNTAQKLFVQFVVSDINENEVENFKTFWTSEGINVKIRPKISWAGLVEASNLQDNNLVNRKPCYWLMQTMNICADGRVALCSVDIHCRVDCGNVNTMSLKEIWLGKLKEYRNMHIDEKFQNLPEMCRNCSDWQSAYADFITNN